MPALAVAQSVAVPGDIRHNVARHVRLAALAADRGARMALFPELSLTSYNTRLTIADAVAPDDERLAPLRQIARARDLVIVAGAPLRSAEGLGIGALLFHPDGGVSTYLKQHLHAGEEAAFTPGRRDAALAIDDEVIGLAICADAMHPSHARAAAAGGATVYAASSLISEAGYAADTALLRGYATEHGVVVMMANYGGPTVSWPSAGRSAIWSPRGELLATAPATGEALVIVEREREHWHGFVVAGID